MTAPYRLAVVWTVSAVLAAMMPARAQPVPNGPVRAVVLPDDVLRRRGDTTERLPPATLHIPEALQSDVHSTPWTTVTVTVQYPAMEPWSNAGRRCFGVCDGKLVLQITRGAGSLAAAQIAGYRRLADENARALVPGGVAAVTPQPAPPGYDASWAENTALGNDRAAVNLYARDSGDGMPAELAECGGTTHTPTCAVTTDLGDGLQLRYEFPAAQWVQRDGIRTAVVRLARSFDTR